MKKLYIILTTIIFIVTFSRATYPDYLYDIGTEIIKPYILIVFDTSGSMAFDTLGGVCSGREGLPSCYCSNGYGDDAGSATWGDGSVLYPEYDVDSDSEPNTSRMSIAKEAISSIVSEFSTLADFGLMRYHQGETSSPFGKSNYRGTWYTYRNSYCSRSSWKYLYYDGDSSSNLNCSHGPDNNDILVDIGEDPYDILEWMDGSESYPTNKELRADGATPIARTLNYAKEYFEDEIMPEDEYSGCRDYYVILMTDGQETCGGDPCDSAESLYDAGIMTHVVGLSIPEDMRDNLNCIAEEGGTEEPLFAEDVDSLISAFEDILNQIVEGEFSIATPTLGTVHFESTEINRIAKNTLLVPTFELPKWYGHLYSYRLFEESEPNSGDWVRNMYTFDLENVLTETEWDAGQVLKDTYPTVDDLAERKIYTYIDSNFIEFTPENAESLNPYLEIEDDEVLTETTKFINYIRGKDSYDSDGDTITEEVRNWLLGDIYHSTSAIVGAPPYRYVDSTYSEFIALYHSGPYDRAFEYQTIYTGANDGMLHAFDAITGEERWAFIPPNILSNLYGMQDEHKFFVDFSPKVDDMCFNMVYDYESEDYECFSSEDWHTVLILGEGWGGNYYFAIDVTNPDPDIMFSNDDHFLWQFTDSGLGQTWSAPAIGKIKFTKDGETAVTWAGFFGSGWSPDGDEEGFDDNDDSATFYIIDIVDNANIIKEWGPSGEDYPGTGSNHQNTIFADANLIDSDNDGYIDRFYVGDIRGDLLKFNLYSETFNQEDWQGCVFEGFGDSKPITSSISTAIEEGNIYVFTGTGKIEQEGQQQQFNIFIDSEPEDSCQDNGSELICGENEINLEDGERVITSPLLYKGVVYFTTFIPDDDPCIVGNSYLRCYNLYNCDPACGEERTDLGEGISSGIVSADDVLYIILSNGEIVIEGDTDAPVNQEGPSVNQNFIYPE